MPKFSHFKTPFQSTTTVAHPSPWITTVAAGTHNRKALGSVTMDNKTYTGASLASAVVTAPIINSTYAGMSGASADADRLCYSTVQNGGTPALDPAKVTGKIVVCDRGGSPRVDKSLAVKEAGGVGMILLNPSDNTHNVRIPVEVQPVAIVAPAQEAGPIARWHFALLAGKTRQPGKA